MSELAPPRAGLSVDYFLTSMTRQLAQNYARLDRRFHGGRIYFRVDNAGQHEFRTLLFDPGRPRLFSGYNTPQDDDGSLPYLELQLTLEQLALFFNGTLDPADPANGNVVFHGNDQAFYEAVGNCL